MIICLSNTLYSNLIVGSPYLFQDGKLQFAAPGLEQSYVLIENSTASPFSLLGPTISIRVTHQ